MDYDVQNGQVPVNPCKVGAALYQKWEAPHIKRFRWHLDTGFSWFPCVYKRML